MGTSIGIYLCNYQEVTFNWNWNYGISELCQAVHCKHFILHQMGAYMYTCIYIKIQHSHHKAGKQQTWRAGRAQWRERSPPTIVTQVQFPDAASWVCCWFSSLLGAVFLWLLQFSPLFKNQHFQIPIRSWNARTFMKKLCTCVLIITYLPFSNLMWGDQ